MGKRNSGPHRESKRRDFSNSRGCVGGRTAAERQGQRAGAATAARRGRKAKGRRRQAPPPTRFLAKNRVFVVRRSHFGGPGFRLFAKKRGEFCNPPTKTCAPNPFYFRLFKVPRDSAKKKSTFAPQRYGISGFAGSYAPFLVRDLRRVSFFAPPELASGRGPWGNATPALTGSRRGGISAIRGVASADEPRRNARGRGRRSASGDETPPPGADETRGTDESAPPRTAPEFAFL